MDKTEDIQSEKRASILRKTSMYGVRKRMPRRRRRREPAGRAGRKPANYDTEVKGGKCFIIPMLNSKDFVLSTNVQAIVFFYQCISLISWRNLGN